MDFFDLRNNGSSVSTELAAGLTSFLASMYIVVVNPAILSAAGMSYSAALTSTILVSAFGSILMGLYSNNPLLVAPGMSVNQLFVFAVTQSKVMPFQTALGCVFWAGVIFLILLLLDRRQLLLASVPRMLRFGMAGGIGLFIATPLLGRRIRLDIGGVKHATLHQGQAERLGVKVVQWLTGIGVRL